MIYTYLLQLTLFPAMFEKVLQRLRAGNQSFADREPVSVRTKKWGKMHSIEIESDVLGLRIIKIGNSFDDACITRMRDEITGAIRGDQHCVIYDFSGLREITSGEGAIFLGFLATVRDYGLTQVLSNLQIPVHKIFNIIGITQAVKVYDSVETAMQDLSAWNQSA